MVTEILIGDCIEQMRGLESGSVDCIIADPPYGTTNCAWDTVIPFEPMWEQLKRITKKNGAIVLFGSQPFTSALVMSNPKMFKYEWVWDKKNPSTGLHAKIMPLRKTENISVFSFGKPPYYPQMEKTNNRIDKPRLAKNGETFGGKEVYRQHKNNGLAYPKNIIEITNANQNNRLHPTQKPVALMEHLVKTYTNEGDTVLDFTCGSGTTGVACEKHGRNFIGIELDPEYAEIARKRIEAVKYIPKAKVLPRYREQEEVRRKPQQQEMF